MTEYIGHYTQGIGYWLEVVPDHTVRDILIAVVVIAVTIVVARYYHQIHTEIVKRVHRASTTEGNGKLLNVIRRI